MLRNGKDLTAEFNKNHNLDYIPFNFLILYYNFLPRPYFEIVHIVRAQVWKNSFSVQIPLAVNVIQYAHVTATRRALKSNHIACTM